MLKKFFDYLDIPEVSLINELIYNKKIRLMEGDFSESFREFQESEPLFNYVKHYAIKIKNEELANAQYVAKQYINLLCHISNFFNLLNNKEYKISWNALQDCLDSAYWIGKYTKMENRFEIPDIVQLLSSYESLYPYKVFASTEMIISKSEWSICCKSFQSFDCNHIKGYLYWGEVAAENLIEVKELQAVAIVSNPLDKRCVMELSNDTRSQDEKFQILDKFIEQSIPIFHLFQIEAKKTIRKRSDIRIVGRNQDCSCGSGKKFKKCCGYDLYQDHLNLIIHIGKKIIFQKN